MKFETYHDIVGISSYGEMTLITALERQFAMKDLGKTIAKHRKDHKASLQQNLKDMISMLNPIL